MSKLENMGYVLKGMLYVKEAVWGGSRFSERSPILSCTLGSLGRPTKISQLIMVRLKGREVADIQIWITRYK